ncbi:hypothetical protein GQ457_18G010000 [Hibiscus cannabinus]
MRGWERSHKVYPPYIKEFHFKHLSIDTLLRFETLQDSRMVLSTILHLSIDTQGEYRYPPLSIDTLFCGYRYPISSIDTLSCRSSFNAGRKLPNGSIDDLTYQNGWKSVR